RNGPEETGRTELTAPLARARAPQAQPLTRPSFDARESIAPPRTALPRCAIVGGSHGRQTQTPSAAPTRQALRSRQASRRIGRQSGRRRTVAGDRSSPDGDARGSVGCRGRSCSRHGLEARSTSVAPLPRGAEPRSTVERAEASMPRALSEASEEVVSLVIHHDEGREVLDL